MYNISAQLYSCTLRLYISVGEYKTLYRGVGRHIYNIDTKRGSMRDIEIIKELIEIKRSVEHAGDFYERDTLTSRIKELEKRIDEMKQMHELAQVVPAKEHENPVRTKRFGEIIDILRKNKKLTSTQLGIITGMSRTRCTEYFRELEKQGIVQGIIDNKKKFYRLI